MKTAVLIDGGHLRACARKAKQTYNNAFIEKFAHACVDASEYLFRIFYYDAAPYEGDVTLPVSGGIKTFVSNDTWLRNLAKLERFAVRRGTLGFRGWHPKNIPISGTALSDNDFSPSFEQKGVDMRIGLDIATFSEHQTVQRVILVSADTDMIPAMKHARKAGLEVVIVQLPPPSIALHQNLKGHADLIRPVAWP